MSICAAFMFFITLLALSLRILLVWRNRALDNKHGESNVDYPTMKGAEDYGPGFRYVL
jgi:hypothetical protein